MYTKLFSSLLTSSIWAEDDKTRIMWITMLASADWHGEVMGSIPGMARLAGMTTEEAERSIRRLESPDQFSRTPTEEGRRIVPIKGGWDIVNYGAYREKANREDRKRQTAERMRRWRVRKDKASQCDEKASQKRLCDASVTHVVHITDTDTDTEAENTEQTSQGEVFTRQSEPARRNTAPAPAPAPDGEGFGEFVNGGDLSKAHDWVAGLFGSTCLSAAELEALKANARAFLSASDADLRLVGEFQRVPRTRLDKAEGWHRPDKCLFWIRDFPEVLRSARRWRDKHGQAARGRRPAPAPMPPGFPAFLREIGHPSAADPDHEWQTNPRAAAAYNESLATTTP